MTPSIHKIAAVLHLPATLAAALGLAELAAHAVAAGGIDHFLVTTSVVLLLAEASIGRPLRRVTSDLTSIRVVGDLDRAVTVPRGPVRRCAMAAAGVVDAVHSVVGKVCFTSTLVAANAQHLSQTAGEVGDEASRQGGVAERALVAVADVLTGADQVVLEAESAAARAAASRELTISGGRDVALARQQMMDIAEAVRETSAAVHALGDRVRSIDGMVAVISAVAEQTNLLALNATIEAARAGDRGRGFAVVAHEVGQLAENSAASTHEIMAVVEGVRRDTGSVLALVSRTAELASRGAELAEAATEALDQIERSALSTTASVSTIITRAQAQRDSGEALRCEVDRIADMARGHLASAGEVRTQVNGLDSLATNLRELEKVFTLGPSGEKSLRLHDMMRNVVQQAAQDVGAAFERAVADGRLSLADLFDEDYRAIPGTDPVKFHTRFDGVTDAILPAIQEPILEVDPCVAYAGAVDRNGYFPTHNLKFSKPLTGNRSRDLVGNRTKRIFDDRVGRRCGSHDLPFLVQTYRRDTGEVMHDVSAPILVAGRQWGGFRIGYTA